jgi:hypothetical protein
VVIKGEKAVNPPKLFARKHRSSGKPSRSHDLPPVTSAAVDSEPPAIPDGTAALPSAPPAN